MKTLYIIPVFLIFFSLSIYAQDTTMVYFDKDWEEISNKDNASFYRKAFKSSDDLWMAYDYYLSGKIQMKSTFKSGKYKKLQGLATYYFENGKKSSEGNMLNNLKTGNWTLWHETGEVSQKGRYEKGQMMGLWQGWYTNGHRKYFTMYEYGERSGSWEYYYESGELKERNTYTNDITFLCEGFYKNSSDKYIGTIQGGAKHGAWTYWNEEGRIHSEGHFKYGVKVLLWTRYFKEGKMEMYYKDGIVEGKQFGGVVRRN